MVNRFRIILLLIVAVWDCIPVNGAGTHSATSTLTEIFHPGFRTLQTKVNGNDQLPPVIIMGGDDRLTVSFDELSAESRYMRYELIHCDSRWCRDALLPSEYVDGFNEAVIDDCSFSQSTLNQYVHYRLEIPSSDMRIKLSGNYLLRIYDESDPAETLLQLRFSVAEPMVDVKGAVTSRTDIDNRRNHQQLTFAVDGKRLDTNALMNDLIVTVSQNGRADNEVAVTRPSFMSGTTAIWDHDTNLIFPAGNEYRRMETVTTNYPGMHVADICFIDPYYHFTLETDVPRAGMPYQYDSTQKGRFRIRSADTDRSDTEAEYVMVHFTLDAPEIPDADIFIDGDMTLRRFSPESLMTFNRVTGHYEAALLLKQGSYNYQYLVVKRGSAVGDAGPIEGNDYQTNNEYLIKVYYREPGGRYDRLVGVTFAMAE